MHTSNFQDQMHLKMVECRDKAPLFSFVGILKIIFNVKVKVIQFSIK